LPLALTSSLLLTSISKYYGSYLALQIPSLNLSPGIHWLRGANGSGKTTLLKILAGLLPFEGDILIQESISIKKNPIPYRRFVNYAEAEPLYPSFLTGTDLLRLFVKTKGAEMNQADELIDLLNVRSFIDHPVGTYSSGMMKKLSLILAFIGHAKIILLDEPLVTIDDASVEVIYGLIKNYHQEKGVTFLLTSHQHFDEVKIPFTSKLIVKDQTITLLPS
jgi:ABC-2 type transport system ATP-binding protein